MLRAVIALGLLLAAGIAAYLYLLFDQVADIEAVCARFPSGADIGDLQAIEDDFSVRLMGDFEIDEKPGSRQALFCATLTLCDSACWVEYRDGRVTRAELLPRPDPESLDSVD